MSREERPLDTDAMAIMAHRLGICPACGKELTKPGYGTGRIADGIFCSMACFGQFRYPNGPGHGQRAQ